MILERVKIIDPHLVKIAENYFDKKIRSYGKIDNLTVGKLEKKIMKFHY